MHESTVSRVTSNKYLACDRGMFELKYFFGSGVASDGGEGAAAEAVKAAIGTVDRRRNRDPERRHAGRPAQGQGLRPRPPHGRQISRGDGHRLVDPAPAAAQDDRGGLRAGQSASRAQIGRWSLALRASALAWTPAASIASAWSTMIRSSAATGRRRMEAGAGRGDAIAAVQFLEAAAGVAPFVGVAHQDGRHRLRAAGGSPRGWRASAAAATGRDRSRCMPMTRSWPVADQQFGHDRAARFQRRQVERGDVESPRHALHQQGIAVPAEVARIELEQRFGMLAAGQALPASARVADAEARPACTGHDRRSARAAPRRRARRCACRLPAGRRCRRRFPGARGARGRAAAAGRCRSPCAYCSWRR